MRRKGLGIGLGMGYKNLVPLDSHIHSLSAKGVKSDFPTLKKIYKFEDVRPEYIEEQLKAIEIELERKQKIGYYQPSYIKEKIGNAKRSFVTTLDNFENRILSYDDLRKEFLATTLKAMTITRVKGENLNTLRDELDNLLEKRGYDAQVFITGGHIEIRNVRLSDDYLNKYGYNLSPYTGRRGRVLNWDNWVDVNSTVNEVLDKYDVSANVSSLGGKFKIRKGKKSFMRKDWDDLANENVGSYVSPVRRDEAWMSEGVPRKKKKSSKFKSAKKNGKVNANNLVDYIMEYEGGNPTLKDTLELFSYLIKTKQAWTLQGRYGREAQRLIDSGYIQKDGTINWDRIENPDVHIYEE